MKILYGVQGTGNGHISRARAMAGYLNEYGAQVTFIFSSRHPNDYFDMHIFGDCQYKKGLTLAINNGAIHYTKTVTGNSPLSFMQEVKKLDPDPYDLVITDYEPVVAWAAQLAGAPCLGLGHQYAFRYDIPKESVNFATQLLIDKFAPATHTLGLHWHHFDTPILPPIIAGPKMATRVREETSRILVYLPFENQQNVIRILQEIPNYRFLLFTNHHRPGNERNVCVFRQSREHFQTCLARCCGVICNAGFELSSEALQLGKKLLVKPVQGQMEQASNAHALQLLRLAQRMDHVNLADISHWLEHGSGIRINYPNVAKAIVEWLHTGPLKDREGLAQSLWQATYSPQRPDLFPGTCLPDRSNGPAMFQAA